MRSLQTCGLGYAGPRPVCGYASIFFYYFTHILVFFSFRLRFSDSKIGFSDSDSGFQARNLVLATFWHSFSWDRQSSIMKSHIATTHYRFPRKIVYELGLSHRYVFRAYNISEVFFIQRKRITLNWSGSQSKWITFDKILKLSKHAVWGMLGQVFNRSCTNLSFWRSQCLG